jgi:glucose/mannose-6-phosphate isomerase
VFALATPLVIAGDALGLLSCSREEVEATAVLLEQLAARHRPDAESVLNPSKTLALSLQGSLPVVWGSSALAGVAAYRFACQLNENSKYPAVWGVLPEAGHNQVGALDGPFAGGRPPEDIFADPVDDEVERTRMHLILLRDTEEEAHVAQRATVARDLARSRRIDVSELIAEGSSPFQRIASLVALADWTSVYLALADGVDPTRVDAIDELRAEASR